MAHTIAVGHTNSTTVLLFFRFFYVSVPLREIKEEITKLILIIHKFRSFVVNLFRVTHHNLGPRHKARLARNFCVSNRELPSCQISLPITCKNTFETYSNVEGAPHENMYFAYYFYNHMAAHLRMGFHTKYWLRTYVL